MTGPGLSRRTFLRALGAGAALVALPPLAGSPPPAAASPCAAVSTAPGRPVAPASVAADLPAPFGYRPDSADRAAILAGVAAVVRQQAADLGADTCYQAKPDQIAERVDFLSPYEFLVTTLFAQDDNRREKLLDLYAHDPRQAISALDEQYPTPRSQAIMLNYAYFDIEQERIRVNAGRVPAADLRRVLVHEFWHAMPSTRIRREGADRTVRVNGFWLQERRGNIPVWLPVDAVSGLPYQPYLLDEAMAMLMETRYAGPSSLARPDIDEVQAYLTKLMAVARPSAVLDSYLSSEPERLEALTSAHRDAFPELEVTAGP